MLSTVPATRLLDKGVKLRHLSKQFRDGTKAITGLDLDVARGELFGLIGPDGAGKTTLFNILCGVMAPGSGEVTVLGRRPADVRHLIGYVTQHFSLFPDLSVEENLDYEAGLHAVPAETYALAKRKYLQWMGLDCFAGRPAGELSGGMKQKLSLCAALIAKPRLLLLDEPTAGLDPLSRLELWQMLAEITAAGVTTIVATPYLDEAQRCNRIALMYEGSIRKAGVPEELQAALGLSCIEIFTDDADLAEKHLQSIRQSRRADIIDIYTVGERLYVLVGKNRKAQDEVKSLLMAEHLSPDAVQIGMPTLDNVFVLSLRDCGLSLCPAPPASIIYRKGDNMRSGPQGNPAVIASGLSRRFGDFQAVKDVNLEIARGQLFGLLGANGAGKTTTIKMLCGLLEPTGGKVVLAGSSDLRSRRLRLRLGYMSQRFTLYESLTVKENIEFYSSIYEIPGKYRQGKRDWALEVCGLAGMQDALVGRLPRGWKQRLAFASSVMHEPEILFLDEPTAGVDPLARRQLWALIRDLACRGTAILITTHYLEEAEYCHNLAFMSEGAIIAQGSPHEIRTRQTGKIYLLKASNSKQAFAILKSNLDSWRVCLFDNTIRILLDHPDKDIAVVYRILQGAGVNIASLHPVPFSLDDAFISILKRKEVGGNTTVASGGLDE